MGWVCKVCYEKAKYLFTFGTGHILNKRGDYRCQCQAYCERHKPKFEELK
jgi:hypothetical protein